MRGAYEVVVVGGGPSGALAAKSLAAAGAKVMLLERDVGRVKPCGGATPSVSFDEFNLPQKEVKREIRAVSVFAPDGRSIDVLLKSGYLAMLERGSFDAALRDQAEKAGVDLSGAEFVRIKERDGKIRITVRERGREGDILSDFLIAADGVNSRVARQIGCEALPGVYTIQEEIDMHEAGGIHEFPACEFWLGSSHAPNFYSWVFPKKDRIDVGTGSFIGKDLPCLMETFKARRKIRGRGRQKVYRIPLHPRRRIVIGGNILLVGDAAGLVMPLSYEGLYYAMKSGIMASEAIARGMPGDYERQWNKKFRKQFKLMEGLRKYFSKNDRRLQQLWGLHRRQLVQETALRLWFEKDVGISSFLSYLNSVRRFLH